MVDLNEEDVFNIFCKAKNLGVRGSSVLAFSFIIFPILVPCVVGAISVFNSIRGFAKYYGRKRMSEYALGVFPYAIGHALSMVIFLSCLVVLIASHGRELSPWFLLAFPPTLLVVCFLPSLIGVILLGRAFDSLSEKSGERMFKRIGLLLPIDSISKLMGAGLMWNSSTRPTEVCMYMLSLISMTGAVSIVAWILAAKAFSKLALKRFSSFANGSSILH